MLSLNTRLAYFKVFGRGDMTVATKVLPVSKTEASDFVPVALFSAVGLLLSLAVMLADVFSAVEWF
jgi:hypothetical protein